MFKQHHLKVNQEIVEIVILIDCSICICVKFFCEYELHLPFRCHGSSENFACVCVFHKYRNRSLMKKSKKCKMSSQTRRMNKMQIYMDLDKCRSQEVDYKTPNILDKHKDSTLIDLLHFGVLLGPLLETEDICHLYNRNSRENEYVKLHDNQFA